MPTLPTRDKVPAVQTWGTDSLFKNPDAWEAEFKALESELSTLTAFKGTLGKGGEFILGYLRAQERIGPRLSALNSYASLRADQDLGNQGNGGMAARARGLSSKFSAAMSFAKPELLAIAPKRLKAFIAGTTGLQAYAYLFTQLNRERPHVRSAEIEELLAQAGDALGAPAQAYSMMANTDVTFAAAKDSTGRSHTVAQSSIRALLGSGDRELRRSAYNSYADGFLGMKNTLASVLGGKIKGSVLNARARKHDSVLAMSLQGGALQKVYPNVIDASIRHLPIWHRYWEARRKLLKLKKLAPHDIFAPVAPHVKVPYARAVEWISEGMAPLGTAYVDKMRSGLTSERWVDWARNIGKRQGAYSNGVYGNKSFILMSYSEADGLQSMSTLAHEVGHSMHSTLSNGAQPFLLARYSLFCAEVASNFNQAMVRAHLLKKFPKRDMQIAIIDEAMGNFHRYLFLMPILSQWEHWAHTQAEQSRALTADAMSAHLSGLFEKGYGPAMNLQAGGAQREGIQWSQFNHFYRDFYVWQYASGIAAANALADGILEDPSRVPNYLKFLSSGGSLDPLDALKLAGCDLSTPAPMDRAYGVLDGFVKRLEALV